ncbi:20021_t:CDS:2 [Dentiscutata erythropus]|uniref:20021_t:CDS:1 n=1 Tax=Dentiscutata erythropus TaxID=1348616 RepID=A0A9N9GUX1_9GLOM|nr:20021_t:CDS:2 [Dentiscutata erythropus]
MSVNNNDDILLTNNDDNHIYEEFPDLDSRRRRALLEIDHAKFQWFHIRACVVSGVGFFTDAYDLFVINLVATMLGYSYFDKNGVLPTNVDMGLKMSAACGTLIGQIFFGWSADRYGRKKIYGLELSIMVVATIGSAMVADSFATTIWGSLVFWRFILGIGIGGDYPLSAVITSEFATIKKRGAMMAAVFAMQGFGILSAAIISVVTLTIFREKIMHDLRYIDCVWRIVLGFGVVPATTALYFRLTIPETPRYTMDVMQDIERAAHDINNALLKNKRDVHTQDKPTFAVETPRATWEDFKNYFSQWENGKLLIGTSISWFVLDVTFYGIGLNNAIILQAIGFTSKSHPYDALWDLSVGNIIINMLGSVPGYWLTVFLIDNWGRKRIQLTGFSVLTILFLVLGSTYNFLLSQPMVIFIILFSLCQLFLNFGPNVTTFVVPGEIFPTRYRSTGHGISAAAGKFGAILSQAGFAQFRDIGGKDMFVPHLIQIFALFMFFGIFSTLLIPETKNLSLEELSNETQIGFVRRPHKQRHFYYPHPHLKIDHLILMKQLETPMKSGKSTLYIPSLSANIQSQAYRALNKMPSINAHPMSKGDALMEG